MEGGKREMNEVGQPAHWADAELPSAYGAETHFRCLVEAFRARFETKRVLSRPGSSMAMNMLSPDPPRAVNTPALPPSGALFHQFHDFKQSSGRAHSRSRERQKDTTESPFYKF